MFSFTDPVFIIAELSANHGGSIETALETIRAAKRAGADAIKLQTYTADTITLDVKRDEFLLKDGLWKGYYLHDLYREAYTPWEWHADLFKAAREEGLICFSSPFDFSSVDFLETFNPPIYKIASFEITDIPLIRKVAALGKPIIISTGIATMDDIELALKTCRAVGNNQITLLKCTSSYPALPEDANLIMIKDLAERFNVTSGLSDHTLGITIPVTAVALGARVIEKHFILNKEVESADAAFSLDEAEFTQMVTAVRDAEKAIGILKYPTDLHTIKGRDYSRSLFVAENMKKGEIFTEQNLRSVRPGLGMHPKFYDAILGKKASKDLAKGEPMTEDYIQ